MGTLNLNLKIIGFRIDKTHFGWFWVPPTVRTPPWSSHAIYERIFPLANNCWLLRPKGASRWGWILTWDQPWNCCRYIDSFFGWILNPPEMRLDVLCQGLMNDPKCSEKSESKTKQFMPYLMPARTGFACRIKVLITARACNIFREHENTRARVGFVQK